MYSTTEFLSRIDRALARKGRSVVLLLGLRQTISVWFQRGKALHRSHGTVGISFARRMDEVEIVDAANRGTACGLLMKVRCASHRRDRDSSGSVVVRCTRCQRIEGETLRRPTAIVQLEFRQPD